METLMSKIKVGPISDSLNGSKQVELRQEVKRLYDDSTSLGDALFSGTRASYTETRVGWKAVPDDATPEIVQSQLDKFPEACLYRIISHKPTLADNQVRLYEMGFQGPNATKAFNDFKIRTGVKATEWNDDCRKAYMAIVENAQLVKYGENNAEGKPKDEPVLANGKKQYRRIEFSQTKRADVDTRIEKAVEKDIELTPRTTEVAQEA